MWRRNACIGVLALLAAGAACVHRPVSNSYRLVTRVLVPPGVDTPDLSRRTFLADIPPGKGHCPPEGGIELQPAGRKLRVTVDRNALLAAHEAGWLAAWSIRAEAQGCVAAGRGEELAGLILESVPMDSAAASRLMNAGILSGYVELGPWSRLEVHSPLLREGTAPDAPILDAMKVSGQGYRLDVDASLAPSVIGFETAWYGLERNAGRAGCHFEALSAERTIQGAVEKAAAPTVNYFQFPPQAAFFRLIYKSEANDVLAFVTAGATREELDRRTKAAAEDSAECGKSAGMCLELPRRVGVNPFLRVRVNGGEVNVRLPASVAAAIREAGVTNPDTVLPRLEVMKLFHGKLTPVRFDAGSRDILNLQLSGGEQLSWIASPVKAVTPPPATSDRPAR
jgi:hypothetical protein